MNTPAGRRDISLPALFQRKAFITGLLCIAGAAVGLGYLVLPGYVSIIALLLCLVFVTGLVRPEYTYFCFIFILVLEMVHLFVTYTSIFEVRVYPYIIPLLATGIGFAVFKIARRVELVRTPVDIPLLLIVFYEVASVIWTPVLIVGAWLALLLLVHYLIFFVTKNIIKDEAVLRKAVRIWIIAGVVAAAAVTVSQWVGVSKVVYITPSAGFKFAFEEQVSRPAGIAGADHAAGFISTAIFMLLGTMAAEIRGKVKLAYAGLVLFMVYAMILTASRGVLIGVGGAYIFFILVHSHFKGKFLRSAFLFAVATLFIILIAKPGFIDRMLIGFGYTGPLIFSSMSYTGTEAATSEGQGLSGMEMRAIWWKNGLHEMADNPLKVLAGLGIGGFIYYSAGGTTVTSPEVNNISFAFFYDMGLFGCVLFIVLLTVMVTAISREIRRAEKTYAYYMLVAATAAMIAETGIHGLVDYDLTSYGAKYFWFPIGFVMAVLNIVKSQRKADNSFMEEV